jgi:hypothetical protein
LRRLIAALADHVGEEVVELGVDLHGSPFLLRVRRHQVDEFDHTGRIDRLLAPAMCQVWRVRIAEVEQRDAQVDAAQGWVGGEERVDGLVEESLQIGRRLNRGEVCGRARRVGARHRREQQRRKEDGTDPLPARGGLPMRRTPRFDALGTSRATARLDQTLPSGLSVSKGTPPCRRGPWTLLRQ